MQTKTNNQFGTHRIARVVCILLMYAWKVTRHKRTHHTQQRKLHYFGVWFLVLFYFVRCRLFHSFFLNALNMRLCCRLLYIPFLWMLLVYFVYSCRPYVWLTAMARRWLVHFNTLYRFFISLALLAIFCICFHCTMRGLVLRVLIGFFFCLLLDGHGLNSI